MRCYLFYYSDFYAGYMHLHQILINFCHPPKTDISRFVAVSNILNVIIVSFLLTFLEIYNGVKKLLIVSVDTFIAIVMN